MSPKDFLSELHRVSREVVNALPKGQLPESDLSRFELLTDLFSRYIERRGIKSKKRRSRDVANMGRPASRGD
jgi:hypothetical protein